MILTTENCTGAIKNTVFSSSMSIALDAIFSPINLCPGYGQIFKGHDICVWHIPSTDIFKLVAKTAKTERKQMKKANLTVDS